MRAAARRSQTHGACLDTYRRGLLGPHRSPPACPPRRECRLARPGGMGVVAIGSHDAGGVLRHSELPETTALLDHRQPVSRRSAHLRRRATQRSCAARRWPGHGRLRPVLECRGARTRRSPLQRGARRSGSARSGPEVGLRRPAEGILPRAGRRLEGFRPCRGRRCGRRGPTRAAPEGGSTARGSGSRR
jgi:hypothetical protein